MSLSARNFEPIAPIDQRATVRRSIQGAAPLGNFLEPWSVAVLHGCDGPHFWVVDAAGVEVCELVSNLGFVAGDYAARIAASVNASRGVPTVWVERRAANLGKLIAVRGVA